MSSVRHADDGRQELVVGTTRRPYSSPTLKLLGGVAELTGSTSGSVTDGPVPMGQKGT
jgi:hypothetical protein